jgi:hypothetical protein
MTNSGFSCITINSLPEISFIAGDTQVFEFTVYDENSSPIDLSSNTLDWNKTPILSATTNVFNVTLDESDTIALSGKFIHQPYIKDYAGNVYRYGQGIITIVPAIV